MDSAIDWKALKASDMSVDVAGNIGTVTFTLARAFPHLKYVVQDLGKVIPDARKVGNFLCIITETHTTPKFWEAHYPEAITDGRVTLQGQN
jgi:O-methyltransferase domain